MAINKVVYGNNTLVDLTNDTVEANNLLEGETAHDRSGNPVTGTAKQGHIVQNSSGTDMTQRPKMQFADSHVSDDEVNGRTVVENIKEVLPADYDSTTDEGIIVCDDGNDVPIGEIEEDSVTVTSTGSDNKNWGDLLLELRNEIDISKVTEFSYLILNDSLIYPLYRLSDFTFTWIALTGGGQYDIESIRLSSSPNFVENYNGTITNKTNTLITSPQKLSLHYGSSSGIVELNTDVSYSTAERKIGKWIDGSDLYEKTVSCGALPNTTSKTFTHGIANISKIVDIKGYATDGTWSLPLPFAGDSTSAISVYANASQIRFVSGADRTSYTTYLTLRYTKS